jgi:hypothetical protein
MPRSPHCGRIAALAALAALLSLVGGCSQDPIDRPGTWQATGANERNLREMVARPSDLERGVAPVGERGNVAALAATRLYVERRRQLLSQRASTVGGQQQPQVDAPLPEANGGGGAGR